MALAVNDTMSVDTRSIDHIVHLTPPGTAEEVSSKFRELGFNVLLGGTHADGLTANALVVLKEGTYIELISFTHPVSYYPPCTPERLKREAHRWANAPLGWIDYAFLGNGSLEPGHRISDSINERASEAGVDVVYLPEVSGGRIRPDGEVLKWVISAPKQKEGDASVGTLPFFCGDVTPRSLRVQTEPPANTVHPSTALGVGHVRLLVSQSLFEVTKGRLTSVIGVSPSTYITDTRAAWILDPALERVSTGRPRLILDVPSDQEERTFVNSKEGEIGIYEVAFVVENPDSGYPLESTTPHGRIIFVEA